MFIGIQKVKIKRTHKSECVRFMTFATWSLDNPLSSGDPLSNINCLSLICIHILCLQIFIKYQFKKKIIAKKVILPRYQELTLVQGWATNFPKRPHKKLGLLWRAKLKAVLNPKTNIYNIAVNQFLDVIAVLIFFYRLAFIFTW